MTTKNKALEQAIATMELYNDGMIQLGFTGGHNMLSTIKSCKEALAETGYPLISLGYGKVEVGTGLCGDVPVILFTNHGTGVIGENTIDEPRVNQPEDIFAAISITNIDSLNVVRKQLDIFASTYLNETLALAQPNEPVGFIDSGDLSDGTEFWGELDLKVLQGKEWAVGSKLFLAPQNLEAKIAELEARLLDCSNENVELTDDLKRRDAKIASLESEMTDLVGSRDAQVAELTTNYEKMLGNLEAVRVTLHRESEAEGSAITDTIWHTSSETLFEFIDEALGGK